MSAIPIIINTAIGYSQSSSGIQLYSDTVLGYSSKIQRWIQYCYFLILLLPHPVNMSRYQATSSVQSLSGIATDSIISQLGQVAEGIDSQFTCGGKYEVLSKKPVKLVYHQVSLVSSEEWNSVEFPGVSEADMIKLLDVCSFTHNRKDVLDKNSQNAFILGSDSFTTSFQISSTNILEEINSVIPMVADMNTELCELNIYAPGGFLKPQVDTFGSERRLGSLMVCLPTHFTGGELIVRHNKQEIKYDWSSTASDTSSTLHWAAFFSDVEHEVLPVNEGYRVTLTYNLSYHSKESNLTFDVKTYRFYKLLQAALSNPVFMCDGGVLGFNSHYYYVLDIQWTDLLATVCTIEDKAAIIQRLKSSTSVAKFVHFSKNEQVKVLKDAGIKDINCKQILDALPSGFPLPKGAEYIMVESAKSLGLPVCIKPFLSNTGNYGNFNYALKDFSLTFVEEEEISSAESHAHQLTHLEMFGEAVCRYKPESITWCQELSYHQPAGATAASREEDYLKNLMVWYKAVAILIKIPKWSNYRQKLSTGEHCSIKTKPDKDGVVEDFKDVIQDYKDIIQEETKQLLGQVEELLDNEYINKVEGQADLLRKMQIKLGSNTLNAKEQVECICSIKYDLHQVRNDINPDSD